MIYWPKDAITATSCGARKPGPSLDWPLLPLHFHATQRRYSTRNISRRQWLDQTMGQKCCNAQDVVSRVQCRYVFWTGLPYNASIWDVPASGGKRMGKYENGCLPHALSTYWLTPQQLLVQTCFSGLSPWSSGGTSRSARSSSGWYCGSKDSWHKCTLTKEVYFELKKHLVLSCFATLHSSEYQRTKKTARGCTSQCLRFAFWILRTTSLSPSMVCC